ncbi:MAG: hypothetical protein D6737_00605 [Chloroflexi bacterium]|nr:MAG: hypothetical protein D6737_00605 [Chloroflexota bacterium]
MIEARDLIKQKRYQEARAILVHVDHPTAQEWIAKIDQLTAQQPPQVHTDSAASVDDLRGVSRASSKTASASLIDQLTGDYFYVVAGGIVVAILIIVVGVFLAGGDGGSSSGNNTGSALTQSANFNGMTIRFPDGWVSQVDSDALILVSSADVLDEVERDPTTAALPRGEQAVAVGFQDTGGIEIPIDEALDLIRSFFIAGAEEAGGEVGDLERFTIGSNEAAAFEFMIDAQTFKVLLLDARSGRIAVFIGIAHDFSNFDATFMAMVRSAQF